MVDDDDARLTAALRRRIEELEARNSGRQAECDERVRAEAARVRVETVAQVENAAQERLYELERDASGVRHELRRLEQENAHLRGVLHSPSFAKADEIVVRPRWPATRLGIERNRAFLLMPFQPAWADGVHSAVDRALASCGMRCDRADALSGRNIMEDIWRRICECALVIADITDRNPNVTYELGLADALGRPSLLLSQTASPDSIPFDLLGQRLIVYAQDRLEDLHASVVRHLRQLLGAPS
jgi:hypothetical protein